MKVKLPPEPKNPRVFKPPQFEPVASNATNLNNSDGEEEEFYGFDEKELEASFFNLKNIISSTPKKANEENQSNNTVEVLEVDEEMLQAIEERQTNKRKADEPLERGAEKRASFDSELMTDDESIKGDSETQHETEATTQQTLTDNRSTDENLSTPERIKRGLSNGVRVSRDSGITSPEPADELMTVTITDSTQPMRRESNDSQETFDTADNGIQLTPLSFSQHDKELVEQAHQRYQEQVTEMQSLVEKVNRWHTHLKPILKEAHEKGHFEIHQYGTRVLESFQTDDIDVSFADVMQNKPEDSIARYFLSTLMLVNTGNVELTAMNTNPKRVSEPEELKLKLKTRVRQHESLEALEEAMPSHCSSRKRPAITQGPAKCKKIKAR